MKKAICILIALIFTIGTSISFGFAVNQSNTEMGFPNTKISDALQERLSSVDENEKVGVYIILYDIDAIEVMAEFAALYPEEYETYMLARSFDSEEGINASLVLDPDGDEYIDTINDEILQTALAHKHELFKEKYTRWNREITDKYLDKDDVLFVSEYSQMIIANLNKVEIDRLAKDEKVCYLEPFYPLIIQPEYNLSNQVTEAAYVRDTFGNKGSGVKVGVLDVGVPDITLSDLVNADITNRSGISTDYHATRVVQEIVGASNGIAPLAKLFCTGFDGSDTSFYSQVEWLIDQNVNVINMSAFLQTINGNPQPGEYDIPSQWIDAIIVQYEIHFVKSAGNTAIHVTSPGLGYNVITVGGYNANGTLSESDDTIYSSSSFDELNGSNRPEKPNLIAPAQNISGVGFTNSSGTSYAAPQVTGAIAQLCSLHSSLKTRQSAMGAILAASCKMKINGSVKPGAVNNRDLIFNTLSIPGSGGQISDFEGAGKLFTRGARWVVSSNQYSRHTVNVESFPFYKTFYQSASTSSLIRVAIYWLRLNTLSDPFTSYSVLNNASFDDLDLEVFDPNGNSIGKSSTVRSNYEIVQFVPTVGGNYTIKVTFEEDYTSNSYVYLGIAIW